MSKFLVVHPYLDIYGGSESVCHNVLFSAAHVSTVEWPLKTRCCGGSLTGTTHDVGVFMNQILLQEAARKGAQAIATVCPLCQYNLDAFQLEIGRAIERDLEMPILYFTQILGWALGGDADSLGFSTGWFPERVPVVGGRLRRRLRP